MHILVGDQNHAGLGYVKGRRIKRIVRICGVKTCETWAEYSPSLIPLHGVVTYTSDSYTTPKQKIFLAILCRIDLIIAFIFHRSNSNKLNNINKQYTFNWVR